MSGLQWTSYTSDNTLDAGYYNINQLYNNAITFFTSPPTPITTGTITTLQLNTQNDTPSFTTFSLGPTERIAIKFTGYFIPTQTGNWTIHVGPGPTTPCDDVGILFLGVPENPITPNALFTAETSVPSSTLPFIRNLYNTPSNSKTVALQANVSYPILLLFNQGRYSYNVGLGFSYEGGSLITDFTTITSQNPGPPVAPITCFKEDTLILTDKGYTLIQNLRKGDLVKTLYHNYIPIDMIGKKEIYHPASNDRIKDQLYTCGLEQFPELAHDLVITGCHCILMDNFKNDEQKEETIRINGKIYVTDGKYRVPACVDDRTSIYAPAGTYTIYHIALENDNYYTNYGVYANGLLVETCSRRYLKELSNMTLIE